jgi:methylated-DNA-[protein]-cysteine S-methyltransferase
MQKSSIKIFSQKVIEIVAKIPKGKVMTYKQVAEKAGNKKASRAVGTIMKNNREPKVPCHRVVKSDGSIGEYNGINKDKLNNKEVQDMSDAKKELLKEEGIKFSENGKVIF